MAEPLTPYRAYCFWMEKQRLYLAEAWTRARLEDRTYNHASAIILSYFRFYEEHPGHAEEVFSEKALEAMRKKSPVQLRRLMSYVQPMEEVRRATRRR